MKKNITINLFGTLYAIDEDAYTLLARYLDDMKKYFSKTEGGEEIAEDIERRVTELVQELQAGGVEALTIEHVKQIIERIGQPEEMDERAAEEPAPETGHRGVAWLRERLKGKKLFRNPDDRMLGGVVSGFACYVNVDATWLRLLVVLLTFLSWGTAVLVYLILWLIVPLAITTADRLQMQGRSVNVTNLGEEILNGARRPDDDVAASRTHSLAHGCVGLMINVVVVLLKALLGVMLVLAITLCSLLLLGALIGLGVLLFAVVGGTFATWEAAWAFDHMLHGGIYWVVLVSVLVMMSLLIYGGVHVLQRWRGHSRPLGFRNKAVYLGALFVSIAVFVSATIHGCISFEHVKDEHHKQCSAEYQEREAKKNLEWLENRGWKVLKHEGCDGYLRSGQFYTGRRSTRYIDGWGGVDNAVLMHYVAEKTVRVAPGTYRLTAVARTDGAGPEIYAYAGKERWATPVPVCGNEGGSIWEQAKLQWETDTLGRNEVLHGIVYANDQKGYGWSRVVVENIQTRDSVLHYGVSNRSADGEWTGRWFSAAEFQLERVK